MNGTKKTKTSLKVKAVIALVLAISFTVPLFAAADNKEAPSSEVLKSEVEEHYDDALRLAGRSSFHGYCNLAVAYQLKSRGVFKGLDYSANGNEWYGHYASIPKTSKTSGGYYAVTYSGKNCLYDLTADYGDGIYNIAYSLGTGGSSGSNHVVLISAIVGGKAYFADSFSYYGTAEGGATALDLDDFVSRYRGMNGSAHGCVYFTKDARTKVQKLFDEKYPGYAEGSYFTQEGAKVYGKESEKSKVIAVLDAGATFDVTKLGIPFARVTVNGKTGYVKLDDITPYNVPDLSVSWTQDDNGGITWNAEAKSPSGSLSYVYYVYRDGKCVLTTPAIDKSGFSYYPTAAGTYKVAVSVSDGMGGKDFAGSDSVKISGKPSVKVA